MTITKDQLYSALDTIVAKHVLRNFDNPADSPRDDAILFDYYEDDETRSPDPWFYLSVTNTGKIRCLEKTFREGIVGHNGFEKRGDEYRHVVDRHVTLHGWLCDETLEEITQDELFNNYKRFERHNK